MPIPIMLGGVAASAGVNMEGKTDNVRSIVNRAKKRHREALDILISYEEGVQKELSEFVEYRMYIYGSVLRNEFVPIFKKFATIFPLSGFDLNPRELFETIENINKNIQLSKKITRVDGLEIKGFDMPKNMEEAFYEAKNYRDEIDITCKKIYSIIDTYMILSRDIGIFRNNIKPIIKDLNNQVAILNNVYNNKKIGYIKILLSQLFSIKTSILLECEEKVLIHSKDLIFEIDKLFKNQI